MNSLAGKHVLVTGASTGFGSGIAVACAEAGADVALMARSEDKLRTVAEAAEAHGVRALVCPVDLGSESQIADTMAALQQNFGPIDVLVNNAGTNVAHRSVEETTPEEWQLIMQVNLTAAYLLTRLVLPSMKTRRQGTIVNVASRAATFPGLVGGAAYSASKMGMQALTAVTNEEANDFNVRACVINPGEGNTPLLDRRAAPPPHSERDKMLQPEDLGATVVFLASLHPRANIWQVEMAPTIMRKS